MGLQDSIVVPPEPDKRKPQKEGKHMYKTFKMISDSLGERYLTVENNIKSKSDSFSSSLLELLEALLKEIYRTEGITIDSDYDTATGILKVEGFRNFCTRIGMTNDFYENMFQLAKKGNKNKHDKIIHISLESVVDGLKCPFTLASYYLKYKGNPTKEKYDIEEISNLYGQTNRELEAKEKEKAELIESLNYFEQNNSLLESQYKKLKEIKQKDDSTYRSLEEKNKALSDEIDELKNIKLSTLEQKVVMIIDLLAKQGESLTRVSNSLETIIKHLEGAARANWGGKPYVGNW